MLHTTMRVVVIFKRPPLKTLQLQIYKLRNFPAHPTLPACNLSTLLGAHPPPTAREFVSKIKGNFPPDRNSGPMFPQRNPCAWAPQGPRQ